MHRHHSTHPRVAASRAHEETLPLFAWAISRPDNHQPLTLPRAAHIVARRSACRRRALALSPSSRATPTEALNVQRSETDHPRAARRRRTVV